MDQLENYNTRHRNRVYYPNCCNYCFSSTKLLICSTCLAVSYCSKEHQIEDWPFHKPTCKTLTMIKNRIPYPDSCTHLTFLNYSYKVADVLSKFRKFKSKECLSLYEWDICTIPWVCLVCFSKPSSKYVCQCCQSVAYCSLKHQEKDPYHKSYCVDLKICRLFNSVDYENGAKYKKISDTYIPLNDDIGMWPRNKIHLALLLQDEVDTYINMSDEEYIGLNLFIEPYLPGASIIHALEAAQVISKRHLVTKATLLQWQFLKSELLKQAAIDNTEVPKSTMTIHLAYADFLDIKIDWNRVAEILIDWIRNIDRVEIILACASLKEIPDLGFDNDKVKVTVHNKLYQKIKFSTAPDLIVVFESARTLDDTCQFWSDECVQEIFRYHNVPIIFFSDDNFYLDDIQGRMGRHALGSIYMEQRENPFTSCKLKRRYTSTLITFKKNSFFTIWKKN